MQEKILQLLEDRKYGEIAALVKDMNPADAAAMLQELPESKMPLVFRCCQRSWRRRPSPIWRATPRRC